MQRGTRKPPAHLSPSPHRQQQQHQQQQPPHHMQQHAPQPLNSDNSINKLSTEITDLKANISFLNSLIDELQYKIVQQKFLDNKIYENTINIEKLAEEMGEWSKKLIDMKYQQPIAPKCIPPNLENIQLLFSEEPKEEPKEDELATASILKNLKYKVLQE